MEYLQQLLDSSEMPIVTALLAGLLTAISPCPLATNITAVGFISRTMRNAPEKQYSVFRNGLLYSAGRCIAYTLLGMALIYILRKGADTFELQQTVSLLGETLLGPALTGIGILMLVFEFANLGGKFGFAGGVWAERLNGVAGAFLLGILFAMAFCPTSGLLFFGILIPLSAAAAGGYALPFVYGVATSIPVVLLAWVLAFSVRSMGRLLGGIHVFQRWFNRLVAVLFIAVGIYYCLTMWG